MMMTAGKDTRRGFPWRMVGWGGIAFLLLLPLAAMQFTADVKWTISDFLFVGLFLGGAGLVVELAARASTSLPYRAGAFVALLASVLLVWVNGAVGFLGDEDNPANLLFLGLLAFALLGAVIAGFRAPGLARTMAATAAGQVLIGIAALVLGLGSPGADGLYEVAIGTGLFTTLWLLAAALFRKAGRSS